MPDEPVEPVVQALKDEVARKALSKATGRLGRLLGINIASALNGAPEKSQQVALAILGENSAVVKTFSDTSEGALKNASDFLNRLADAVEQQWSRRYAVHQMPIAAKPIPEVTVSPTKVRKLGVPR